MGALMHIITALVGFLPKDMQPLVKLIISQLVRDPMVPNIVETQLLQIGQFVIIPGPAEFT